jgi:O-antigen/teichoic acid export membrane protein
LDLKKQSINGVIWTFIDILINRGAYFIATIVLAGILGPKEFGLLGMIMVFVAIGNSLVDSGMSTSLLRSNNVSENDYSTVFITNILMSVLVYIILFFSAPYIAFFYKQPVLVGVIRWYCLGFVITSFRSIHSVRLMKEMKFKKLTLLDLPGIVCSVVIAVWMGYSSYGIWSLVALFLINQIVSTITYWIFIKWRPNLYFDFENYKKHFRFGYKLVLSSQINTIFENVYNVIIGKFYSVQMLGFYERAYTFNNYPISVLSGTIMKVSLPSLVLVKNDSERLQNAYKNIMQMTFLLSASCLSFASLLAPQIFTLILGKKWLEIVPLFQVLSICFVFYPIHSLNINVLNVFGRSDLFLKLEIVKKMMLVVVVAICFSFGIMGLVWASAINSVLALIINTHYGGKFLNYPTKNQLLDLLPTIIIVFLSILIVYGFEQIYCSKNIFLDIFFSFIVFLSSLILISEKTKLVPYINIKQLVLAQVKK